MKQSKTITRLAMMLIATLISSCALAQNSDASPKEEEDSTAYFYINTIGAQLWAEGPDAKIVNDKDETITMKELIAGGNFNFTLPTTILTSKSSTTLHNIFDKSFVSKEEMAKIFVDAVFSEGIEGDRDCPFSVEFAADDNERRFNCARISLSAYYKHPQFNSVYRNLSLYNIRYLNAYAIVETAQLADAPLVVDSIASKNRFMSTIVPDKSALLTMAQMDSVDDGFDIIPVVVELLNAKAEEKGNEAQDTTSMIRTFATYFRDNFGYYPPSFEATHKDYIEKESQKTDVHSLVTRDGMNQNYKVHEISITDPNVIKRGRVTINTAPKPRKGPMISDGPIMMMNNRGQVIMRDPMKSGNSNTRSFEVSF